MTSLGNGEHVIGNMRVRREGDKWAAIAGNVRLGRFDLKGAAWDRLKRRMDEEHERRPI